MDWPTVPLLRKLPPALFWIGSLLLAPVAQPAATDLANGPLANGVSAATTVKPNLAFIVDDSGSMDDENMPDDNGSNRSKPCWGWHRYNTLAYNPAVTYKPPYKPDGTEYGDGVPRYADASFTAARFDGYFPVPGYTYGGDSNSNYTSDLSDPANLRTTDSPKYYYSYPTAVADQGKTTCLSDSKYTAVTSAANIAAPGVSTGSNEARTNYANWYSYYRKRAFMMKAATAEAFADLSDQYRVGLFFIASKESGSEGGDSMPNSDLKIDDLSGAHRSAFFSRLLENRSAGWTPLRAALARAGRMYAGRIAGWDPVQYSCQQNFAILSTDGYWNTNYETTTYGPYRIDGTSAVGNVDGGPVAAVPASATISWSGQFGGGSNGCYRFTSITVDAGNGAVELLDAASAPASCSTSGDTLGNAVATSINNRTGSTGFSASFDSGPNTLSIVAPAAAGALATTPAYTVVKDSGKKSRNFSATAFAGYTAGSAASAPLPYRDGNNAADTLGDIAYYYYTSDLRSAALDNCSNTIGATTYANLCENNVLGAGKDVNQQQHMTTFTIGLGASGSILYERDYETAPKDADGSSVQYYDIKNGTSTWPDPIDNSGEERIDDLWHAAVNGRGTYYSASNAENLADGIRSALAGISARTGSSSAAATSTLQPTESDKGVFVALYRTVAWDGEVKKYDIDPNSGELSENPSWQARDQLDTRIAAAGAAQDGRSVKYFSAGAGNQLNEFTYANLSSDGQAGHFDDFCSKTPLPDQCGVDANDLGAPQRSAADLGDNLVKYLRGQTTHEDENSNPAPLYRGREHALGDIVSAVPVYQKQPKHTFGDYDTTYGEFKAAMAERAATLYVAANDGMLHAFNADSGAERWAYVPSFVMPGLWQLADRAYANNHRYFVDGPPVVADVCGLSTATGCTGADEWRSILVAGLNKGGCGYYALDVTDPANPKGLWEFTHEQLGYSYGVPQIARRKDGRWVVLVSSGYNNIPSGGCPNSTAASDGNGYVFVLDALSGTLLDLIPTYLSGTTPAGTTTTPSGLAQLNLHVDNGSTGIAGRAYGGDLLGNVWRIDFDDNLLPDGKEATLLAQLKSATNVPQPITIRPELNTVKMSNAGYNAVFVATGRYLGTSDPSDASQNTIYALKDTLAGTIADVRGATMVARSLLQTTNGKGQTIRTVSGDAMDWASRDGWYIDLNPGNQSPGERVTVNTELTFNLWKVAANVPDANVCNAGGYSYLYSIDTSTGKALTTASDGAVGVRLSGNALVVGIKTVRLLNGRLVSIVTDSSGQVHIDDGGQPTSSLRAWRTSWREIPN
ncbi:MAG TPA: PilC/PilY family type IV pilus protein [Azospira sp.]|nr:PilC/PilY family type IV pilus protein [Azospira sp.]